MKTPQPSHNRGLARPLLLTLVLAAVCIGGMELAFCSHFSPVLYHQITDPVVQPVVRAANHIQSEYEAWQAARRRDALTREVLQGAEALPSPRPLPLPEVPQLAEELFIRDVPEPAAPAVTQFIEEDGQAILTGGTPLVYFNQGDEAWRDKPYGSDPIGPYGCGPVAMAMVVATLSDQDTDPAQMTAWAAGQGYWCPGSGSYLSIVEGTAKAYGLNCSDAKHATARDLFRHLCTGGMAVALVGPGHFTNSGHFIVLHGATLSGEVLVGDPNSRETSLAAWDPQLILDEAAASTGDGARLWFISKPRSL